jgi:hypothetical protein
MKEKEKKMSILLTLVASCKPASNRIGPADVSKAVRTADTSWAYIQKTSINLYSMHPRSYTSLTHVTHGFLERFTENIVLCIYTMFGIGSL